MKRVIRVKLQPDAAAADSLKRTLSTCNEAADFAARAYREQKAEGKRTLQRMIYPELKARGLSAQPALLVISKVAGAYATLSANLKAGNYGKKDSDRCKAIESKSVTFRPTAAQPFDDRCLSWQHQARTVSIWSIDGRLKNVPFTGKPEHLALLASNRKGETDLMFEGGNYYLLATIDEPAPEILDPVGFIGVDLGIVNIATTSTGQNWSGGAVTAKRKHSQRLRTELQAKGTKSAKRKLKKRSKTESRFVTDTNHRISKKIVTEAQRTGRGIALEILTGIRERARLRKPQRVALHSWAFAQLGAFITYKALAAGVPVLFVDPAYTSQECSAPACGYIDKKNRRNQAEFVCLKCGTSLGADENASVNICVRGEDLWAVISCPNGDQANPA